MVHLLRLVLVLATWPAQGQEPAARPNAPIQLGGTFTGGTIELKTDEKTLTLLVVEVGKDQTVYLHTEQRLGDRGVARAKKLEALSQEQRVALIAATKNKKGEDLKKAFEAVRREFEDKRKAVDWVVVRGTLVKDGPILSDKRSILVEGEIHDADATAKPLPPQRGFATVEGEVKPGKVELGIEVTARFSINAGKSHVAIVGNRATDYAAAKGGLRVTGRLRIDDSGRAFLEAELFESLKK